MVNCEHISHLFLGFLLLSLNKLMLAEYVLEQTFPTSIYLLKSNNKNTGTRCETCSKLTIKTPAVFIVNFEHISHLVLVFLLLTLSRQMLAGLYWLEGANIKELSFPWCKLYWNQSTIPAGIYLFKVQSQQYEHQNKMWNMLKVNNK